MSDTPSTPPNQAPWFADDDHALHQGFLAGTLMKAGIAFNFVKDEFGNYKPYLEIVIPSEDVGLPPTRVTIKVLPGGPDG